LLRGEESNPYSLNQNQASYRLNDPGNGGWASAATCNHRIAPVVASTGSLPRRMGSLIKKRRKRMRKKKHKKMLRRTRHQRRK
jgi:hypothetical protein